MKFTLLGTGTSQGIPVIGCQCETCTSTDPRDKRLRCSALIGATGANVMIDIGPDFRIQALRANLRTLDAVFLTHEHNDHIAGLDDLRPMIFKNKRPMTIYGEERVLRDIKDRFKYAFRSNPYPGVPSFDLKRIHPGDEIKVGEIKIKAVRVFHGKLPILGFVVNDRVAYLTDTNEVGEDTLKEISGIPLLILDMLREQKHLSHYSFNEAIETAASVRADQTFFIHMSHLMGPTSKWETKLPANVYPAFDELTFDLP